MNQTHDSHLGSSGGGDARTRVALVHDVFHGNDAERDLLACLNEAKRRGACLAVLPELPFDQWMAVDKERKEKDAEDARGRRHSMLCRCAQSAGITVLGGAIVTSGKQDGRRYNTSLLVDREGTTVLSYQKMHLPEEPGYYEVSQYDSADAVPGCVEMNPVGMVGLQTCSDIMRPAGWSMLGARGAEVILVPRATPITSYERWKTVLRTMAITCAAYVFSVNRPSEEGVPHGGPSIAIRPNGEVLLETSQRGNIAVVEISKADVLLAKTDYPGYVTYRSDIYAKGWGDIPTIPIHHHSDNSQV